MEIQKTRPAVVVSPNEMNDALGIVLVAPITSRKRNFPTRIAFDSEAVENYLALDQIRAVDKSRLSGRKGVLSDETSQTVCDKLQEMFAY